MSSKNKLEYKRSVLKSFFGKRVMFSIFPNSNADFSLDRALEEDLARDSDPQKRLEILLRNGWEQPIAYAAVSLDKEPEEVTLEERKIFRDLLFPIRYGVSMEYFKSLFTKVMNQDEEIQRLRKEL